MGTAMPNLAEAFSYPFMVNALMAGTIVAVLAGALGWFMVLRRQTFVGHTLAIVSFPGATAAVLLGISASTGAFTASLLAAVCVAWLVGRTRGAAARSRESAFIGTLQAFALACGLLFASLQPGSLSGVNALLFGSFLGITRSQVLVLLVIAVLILAALVTVARPLLFASLDPAVAAARRVSAPLLSLVFLGLLALAAASVSQITGALLVFALLVLPPATAQLITPHPGHSLALGIGLALIATWGGLLLAFYASYPLGFFITSLTFGTYVLVRMWRHYGRKARLLS